MLKIIHYPWTFCSLLTLSLSKILELNRWLSQETFVPFQHLASSRGVMHPSSNSFIISNIYHRKIIYASQFLKDEPFLLGICSALVRNSQNIVLSWRSNLYYYPKNAFQHPIMNMNKGDYDHGQSQATSFKLVKNTKRYWCIMLNRNRGVTGTVSCIRTLLTRIGMRYEDWYMHIISCTYLFWTNVCPELLSMHMEVWEEEKDTFLIRVVHKIGMQDIPDTVHNCGGCHGWFNA